MSRITKRASLPLTKEDVDILRLAADANTAEGRRLAELATGRELTSEASLLRAVFEIGLQRIRADVMFEGYEQLAASYEPANESDYAAALKRRTRRHHDDEAT